MTRDLILAVDNGTQSYAGLPLGNSFMTTLSPLSNTTGSQTLNGNITLNNITTSGGSNATARKAG